MAKRTPAFKAQKVKMSAGDYVFAIIDYLVFGIFTAACIFPFYYLIINTISNNKLVAAGKINFWPVGFHLDNYANIFKLNDLGNAFVVTLSRTIIGTALMVFGSALCGYLFTRNEMWHKKFWYRFVIVTMYLNAGIIPWYLNMSMLGLTNNYLAYILPGIMVPYNLILVKTYIESIPPSLEESAQLDGAGYAASAENCRTKTPGVFVAGDNRQKEVRQLVTAASDGAVAATEAVKYLNE